MVVVEGNQIKQLISDQAPSFILGFVSSANSGYHKLYQYTRSLYTDINPNSAPTLM